MEGCRRRCGRSRGRCVHPQPTAVAEDLDVVRRPPPSQKQLTSTASPTFDTMAPVGGDEAVALCNEVVAAGRQERNGECSTRLGGRGSVSISRLTTVQHEGSVGQPAADSSTTVPESEADAACARTSVKAIRQARTAAKQEPPRRSGHRSDFVSVSCVPDFTENEPIRRYRSTRWSNESRSGPVLQSPSRSRARRVYAGEAIAGGLDVVHRFPYSVNT